MLTALNLRKYYNNHLVVEDISIKLAPGSIVGLLGPNGAGKTTCFYMISGLVKPDAGAVYLDDHEITKLPIYERARIGIGYLPQETCIFRGLTVMENIMIVFEAGATQYQTGYSEDQKRILLDEILEEFNLTKVAKVEARMLSGGEIRRLEIARTLALNPRFILLDEPFAGVDPISISEIKQMIAKLAAKTIGILITDHNVRETLSIVNEAYIINHGKIIASGCSQEIIDSDIVKKVYLGENFM